MFRSVTPKEILAQLKMRWKLHFVEHGIHGQQRAQVCFVRPV